MRFSFRYPKTILDDKQRMDFLKTVIGKYQKELPLIRRMISTREKQITVKDKTIEYWKRKFKEEKEVNEKLKKKNEKLKKEIEKLTKTNNRCLISLFDHGNFKSDSNGKDKKPKGGQIGHADTNRETYENYSSFIHQRLSAKNCGICKRPLTQVRTVKEKILIDIVLNPTVVKMILESERQWCGHCQKEVNAKDTRSLPFTEYGINTFMMVMILRFQCHSSLNNVSTVIRLSHGLYLSKSDVNNLLHQAKNYLQNRYDHLIKQIRQDKVMYNDETGWLVNGQSAWLWIMANDTTTVYYAAESRGKGIMEEMYGNSKAFSMHDGLASYEKSVPKDKTLYCWAHLLRFAFEETILTKKYSTGYYFRKKLVNIYHLKDKLKSISKEEACLLVQKKLKALINQKTNIAAIINIQERLKNQKEGLIRALMESPDGTNNLAERELRPMVINKRISFGSNTFSCMETTAVLGSIIQTLTKKEESFLPSLKSYLQAGVSKKYPQYQHIAYIDSS